MASETDTKTASEGAGVLALAHCKSLTYWLSLRFDAFELDAFTTAVAAAGAVHGGAICSPKNPSSGYHLHLQWHKRENDFAIRVEFLAKPRNPDPDEKEPYAETFFQWLDQFVISKEPQKAHAHAEFRYPGSVRSAKFMLLPLRTRLGPKDTDVEIDGLAFSISPPFEGVERMWTTQHEDELWVYLIGDRVIRLKTFDVAEEAATLSRAADILSKEECNDAV